MLANAGLEVFRELKRMFSAKRSGNKLYGAPSINHTWTLFMLLRSCESSRREQYCYWQAACGSPMPSTRVEDFEAHWGLIIVGLTLFGRWLSVLLLFGMYNVGSMPCFDYGIYANAWLSHYVLESESLLSQHMEDLWAKAFQCSKGYFEVTVMHALCLLGGYSHLCSIGHRANVL